ncbi:histidine utilization repressor [Aestuariibacter sp. AA17]|uniref:Histidine utilization repressor n=1 Tax=Fluctibacter corallii TaxID=2984329 RepID=A0ABT3A4Z2_9ALTE|nr:histidine utilization repressor [Aestuariibacter sp. AA17]MCV2883750.1 histidine utilization repressor [Aestuariibacter sp. AA17]
MQPRFTQIKSAIMEQIEQNEMKSGDQVPSENQLAEQFGVSRMTARRALTELVDEGILMRSQGLGTFVSDHRPMSSMLAIKSINEEIRQRGHRYHCDVIHKAAVTGSEQACSWLGVPAQTTLFHTLIVHFENAQPVQLESRWVNPQFAPDYLKQDFNSVTANQYLSAIAPLTQADHIVEATLPDSESASLLNISTRQPCLKVSRRTFSAKGIVSYANLLHPGNRYRLGGHLDF